MTRIFGAILIVVLLVAECDRPPEDVRVRTRCLIQGGK